MFLQETKFELHLEIARIFDREVAQFYLFVSFANVQTVVELTVMFSLICKLTEDNEKRTGQDKLYKTEPSFIERKLTAKMSLTL